MAEFWKSSGIHLLGRTGEGRLTITDDFLRAYYARPELAPAEQSCAAERALHDSLMAEPGLPVGDERLGSLADRDVADNWRMMLGFRDRLLAADTLESAYRGLFGADRVPVPPLFVDQLAHVILRGILDTVEDPFRARAAELFFRSQTALDGDGAILLGDAETVAMYRQTGGFGDLGKLLAESGAPMRNVELAVLNDENAEQYWGRSDRFDTVLDLTFGRRGLDALCRVLESWIGHFLDAKVSVQPVSQVRDERWVWHVGLDAVASAILNDLYNGAEVDDDRLARLISLFRLEFADPAMVVPRVRGRPVYMALARADDDSVRLKPQNLLVNLPLAEAV
jgi:hypothetical protein